ncbi:MAG: 3-oxoacyl-ACP synthase [Acidobacteria bacterium]|nr:3-oxoacyl-ACP synthase [Acidobacteriota bacterium]
MIGITASAVWLPHGREDAAFVARQTGIPQSVVAEKMGLVEKCRAHPDVHPSMMAIEAARAVLKDTDPESVDLLIWTGSEYKDFPVWSAGIFVQHQLGLTKAWAFDLAARCSSNVVGLRVAKDLMLARPEIRRTLLCGGHRTGDLVNYQDPDARFLFNLSDGGSALLLERDAGNPLLESSVITDGAFSLDVIIPAGGTRNPNRNPLDTNDTYLRVPDVVGMRGRLADRSIENFLRVIRQSSAGKAIDFLALVHLKRSAHDAILEALGLGAQQSIYLDHYGHFGAPDQVLSMGLAETGQLTAGDHVVLASAGIGYTWSAISLEWRQPTFTLIQEATP